MPEGRESWRKRELRFEGLERGYLGFMYALPLQCCGRITMAPMLLQTHSYFVPSEHRDEHAKLMASFASILKRLGVEHFQVYEQVGDDFAAESATGRFVQTIGFRDAAHRLKIQELEVRDPEARRILVVFSTLIDLPMQREQGLFSASYYASLLGMR